jgi:hypothetical protein
MLDLKELYWAAGFVEGEGTFGAGRNSTGTWLHFDISQVELEPLLRLQKCLGGRIYGPYRKHPQRKPIYQMSIAPAAGAMMTLWPLMSKKRKDQIASALKKWRNVPVEGSTRKVCINGHPFDGNSTILSTTKKRPYVMRICRICRNDRAKAAYRRNQARILGSPDYA